MNLKKGSVQYLCAGGQVNYHDELVLMQDTKQQAMM